MFRRSGQLAVWCMVIVGTVYGSTLWLPYFFDDLDHLPFALAHSYREIWRDVGAFPYYRPIGVSILKLTSQLFGNTNSIAHHAVNLFLHAGNGWLLGILCLIKLKHKPTQHAFVAALLFLIFPFSYQAVPWVDAVYHLIVTTLLLSAIISYHFFQANRGWLWAILSLTLTLLAPFAHENGFWAGPLIALIGLLSVGKHTWTILLRDWLLWGVVSLGSLFLWLGRTPVTDSAAWQNPETIMQNSSYFVQGLIFPLAWIGSWAVAYGVGDLRFIWVTAALILCSVGIILWKRTERLILFFVCWFVCASLLSILFLPFSYVIDGARLLMVASSGIAGIWAMVLIALWSRGNVGRITTLILLTITILPSINFISQRIQLHQILGEGFDAITASLEQSVAYNRQAVFVNARDWLTLEKPTYALGHEGVMFLPDYMPPQRIIETNFGRNYPTTFFSYNDIIEDLPYIGGIIGNGPAWEELSIQPSDIYLLRYAEQPVTAQLVGQFQATEPLRNPTGIFSAGSTIMLDTVSYDPATNQLQLTWYTDGKTAPQITAFVHALDENGALLAQSDGQPISGMYPFSGFSAYSVVGDVRYFSAENNIHTLNIGIYDTITGQRWLTPPTKTIYPSPFTPPTNKKHPPLNNSISYQRSTLSASDKRNKHHTPTTRIATSFT